MAVFESCYKCEAPKRHPGCHDTCPDYNRDKAAYNEKKAGIDKRREVDDSIRRQKYRGVDAALKRGRHRRRIP